MPRNAGLPADAWPGAPARAELLSHLTTLVSPPDPPLGGSDGQDVLPQVLGHLLAELRRALSWDKPALFADCVGWAKAVLIQQGLPASALALSLQHIDAAARRQLSGEAANQASRVVMAALQALTDLPDRQPAFLSPGRPLSPLAIIYFGALLRGDRQLASRLVLQAAESGVPIKDVYLHVFQPAQYEIGHLWQLNRISVAEEHYCTAATQLIMSQLYSHIFSGKKIGRTVLVVCVSGDLHELGARMVADFFEMEGWNSYYTGAITPISAVLQAVVECRADLLAISVTIAQHVPDVERLIALVRSHPTCGGVKIIAGGLPFHHDPDLWRRVGADGTGRDAETAVSVGSGLVDAAAHADA